MADEIAAYEKLGAFYLGRPYDPAKKETNPAPLLYDSRDLLTHAMCVGMTGSGKTGLLIGLLEEAAIDHIPNPKSAGTHSDPFGQQGEQVQTVSAQVVASASH
jgi:hypothetical protein